MTDSTQRTTKPPVVHSTPITSSDAIPQNTPCCVHTVTLEDQGAPAEQLSFKSVERLSYVPQCEVAIFGRGYVKRCKGVPVAFVNGKRVCANHERLLKG